jgi:tape measure domain-containing protein
MGNVVDTLEYVKELRAAGVPEQQAEAQAKALSKAISEGVVTKEHFDITLERMDHRIDTLEEKFNHRIDTLEEKVNHRIDTLEEKVNHRIEQLEYRLTIRMGGMIAAAIAALAAIMRLH